MGCLNALWLRVKPARAFPFVIATLAVVSRCAHVLDDDLFPPEKVVSATGKFSAILNLC